MFVQIGNRDFAPSHITQVIRCVSSDNIIVYLDDGKEIVLRGDECAEFMAWRESVDIIIASELVKREASLETSTSIPPAGYTADVGAYWANRIPEDKVEE